jgi:fermentation-respiration switch protein FrsA (DUF1100 family)
VVIAYLGYALLMFSLQRFLIFPRWLVPKPPAPEVDLPGFERWSLVTDEGEVEAWFIPGAGVSAQRPGPAAIFAHGNAELIDHWPGTLEPYLRMGVSLLLVEYRGYGRSAGSPSQATITDDFVRFYDRLVARAEVDPRRIVLHGRSLGGGVVCALAAKREAAALILMSTFTSVADMARRYLMPRALVRDPFDNLAVIQRFGRPVLIVHGERDVTVPFRHAELLHRAAARSRLVRHAGSDHNDCPPDWPAFWRDVKRLLDEGGLLGQPPRGNGSPL